MKKRIVSGLLVFMLVFLTGCGAKSDAETAFATMMKAFQTGEAETIRTYYDFNQESKFVNPDASDEMLRVVLGTMQDMKYHIESVEKIDGANVKITARVTTLDFSQVMDLYIERLMMLVADETYQAQVASLAQTEYQKLIADQMAEILTGQEIDTEEKTVSVTMVKEKDQWVPGGDRDAFFDALFGNLIGAVNSLI
ncbi:MAG: DUF5105 domain-containing protein [Clostridia bacterium]|nr:DUF5105 domain-containing protein [Clostridia bacterium]